ncbi:MAG: ABC transporter permease [Microthrixaceae bacterium]
MMIIKKLAQLVATVILVTLFASLLLELLPGDAAEVLAPSASPDRREQLREQLHLNDPVLVRYGRWLGDFVTGDFGNYYTVSSQRPVADRLKQALPVSLLLMLYAQVLALLIAIPVGIFASYKQGSWFDRLSGASAFAMLAIPNFVLGFVLQYYLGVKLGWFKTTGYRSPSQDLVEHVQYMILPTVTLAVGQVAVYQRLLRTDMIATLQEDFILMAKAKGLRSKRILFRHALRPSSLTLLTVAGLNVGTLIGGALIVEVVFALPGMGTMLFEAISRRQIVAFQSMVAVIAILYVLVNFVVDLLYTVLDPRIRNSGSK